jgi:hypothetical protein
MNIYENPTSNLLKKFILGNEPKDMSELEVELKERGIDVLILFNKIDELLTHLGREIDITIEDNQENSEEKVKEIMSSLDYAVFTRKDEQEQDKEKENA